MHYTYILESISSPAQSYIGHTSDIRARIQEHNEGKCIHTAKLKPCKPKCILRLKRLSKLSILRGTLNPDPGTRSPTDISGADNWKDLKTYLKTHSGRAFASKHC
jgi:hypothetical protein